MTSISSTLRLRRCSVIKFRFISAHLANSRVLGYTQTLVCPIMTLSCMAEKFYIAIRWHSGSDRPSPALFSHRYHSLRQSLPENKSCSSLSFFRQSSSLPPQKGHIKTFLDTLLLHTFNIFHAYVQHSGNFFVGQTFF